MAMATRTATHSHYKWDEIQARHFKTLAESLPDPNLWPAMLGMARSAREAIASVKKRLPRGFKESVWASITKGFAKKADEFLSAAEALGK